MAYVRFPDVLKKSVNHLEIIHMKGETVFEVLQNLFLNYPSLKPLMFPSNALSPFINIYLNHLPIHLSNIIKEDDEIHIVAALSGG